jgi:hypothetical protein
MPARPGHRLDIVLVPDGEIDETRLPTDVFGPDGAPGAAAGSLVAGGFRRWRVDRPGRTVLYANQQGGFQVRCPVDGRGLVRELSRAIADRADLDPSRRIACGCGATHRLDELTFLPDAAFGRTALVLHDAEDGRLTDSGARSVREALGPLRIILRRVS